MLSRKSYYLKTTTDVHRLFVKNHAKKHLMLYKQLLFGWMDPTSKMSMMKLKLSLSRMKMEDYQMEWSMSISMKDSMNTAKKLSFI